MFILHFVQSEMHSILPLMYCLMSLRLLCLKQDSHSSHFNRADDTHPAFEVVGYSNYVLSLTV